MVRRLQAFISCALLGIGFGACASEDKPTFDAGVDGNLDLGTLTPDQKVTICKNQAAFVHAHVDTTALTRFLCAFTPAVFTAADDAHCEAAMTDCINAFSVKVDVTATDPNAPAPECALAPLSQCTGTVSTYEGCVNQLADVQLQIGTDWSCGKRSQYANGPTVGVTACQGLGPTCTAASQPPVIR
jgi:hypothetical protein